MDDEDDKPIATSRFRSPAFSKEETDDLINLIHKYRRVLLNKSLCASACQAKDACWAKVTKLFNSENRVHIRTTESLKTKWENIKKEARKLSKNVIDLKDTSLSSQDVKVFTMLNDAESSQDVDTGENYDEEMGSDTEGVKGDIELENNDKELLSVDEDDNENEDKLSKYNRTTRFSVKECTLLLQCVRQEKDILFSKDLSYANSQLKNKAWTRITNSYNNLSPRKRSTKVLITKFKNMKSLVKKVGFKDIKNKFSIKRNKHDKLVDKKTVIKKEPDFIYNIHEDCDWNDNDEEQHHSPKTSVSKLQEVGDNSDPLCTVLNSDSGLGSSSHLGCNYDAEVVKLKMELLNYQMETAKMERRRVEDALAAEAKSRETLEIEQAMRLRSARLEAVAAALRLPPTHPALAYTHEESRAHAYITQYRLQHL